MSESIRQKMIDELSSVRQKTINKVRATVLCPFHADKNPSATINLSLENKVPLGWFGCWTCKKSVPWNTYAQTQGLRVFGKGGKKSAEGYVDPKRFKDELLAEDGEKIDGFTREMTEELTFFDFQQEEWRDVPIKLLQRVGARLAYLDRTGEFYIWLPVLIHGELKGYVKACLEKPEEGPAYFNASGTWSGTHGFLFHDYAVKLAEKKGINTVVLVEGPRDALRLLRYGIPAMAVLGALNWNEEKRYTLEQSGFHNVILFMDGDDAGLKATKAIYKSIKTHFNVRKIMKLWRERTPRLKENGKQMRKKITEGKYRLLWDNERDPGNCDLKHLRTVRDALV